MALTKDDKQWFEKMMDGKLSPVRQTLYGENGDKGIVQRVEEFEEVEKTVIAHSTYWKIASIANGVIFAAVVGILVNIVFNK